MPKSPQVPISPDPFVTWNFTAGTPAEKREKIARARSFLEMYLKGHLEGLKKSLKKKDPPLKLSYRVVNVVTPVGKDKFTYAPTVKRRPVTAGEPESGKDPVKPTPPPQL